MSDKIIVWKVIDKFPHYEVSNAGEVRRCVPDSYGRNLGNLLAKVPDKDGYLRVRLTYGGIRYTLRVHKIVAITFIGPVPEGKEINHKDGNKNNNCDDNFEYITNIENLEHKTMMGLCARGEINGSSKLTTVQVVEIRRLASTGVQQKKIAKQFNIGISAINNIVHGQTWRHLL